jgi:hypothetical protein
VACNKEIGTSREYRQWREQGTVEAIGFIGAIRGWSQFHWYMRLARIIHKFGRKKAIVCS